MDQDKLWAEEESRRIEEERQTELALMVEIELYEHDWRDDFRTTINQMMLRRAS